MSYLALILYLLIYEIHTLTYQSYTLALDNDRFDQELFDLSFETNWLLRDLRLRYFL